VKRFLRDCVNGVASKHHRNVNNVTDLGYQSFKTNALMKELIVVNHGLSNEKR